MTSKTSFEQKGRPLRQRWARQHKLAKSPVIGCAALRAAVLFAGTSQKAATSR